VDFIKEWVTNIILFVLFATVIDMLLPDSKFQKYTKMVMGLLLIAIVLTPIFKIFSQDFEKSLSSITSFQFSDDDHIENLIELQKKEIQASNDAYILEQTAVQMKKDVQEELMNQYGFTISNIELLVDEENQQISPDNLQKVVVQLQQEDEENIAVEAVKPVEINTEKPQSSKSTPEYNKEITQLLSERWTMDEEAIEVLIEGGNVANNE
jgi:stage III sporulation protein AF